MRNDFVYDIETYPNVFTLAIEHADAPLRWLFEISDRRNDSSEICQFIYWLKDINARMVGFNNLGFDYPVLHMLVRMGRATPYQIYEKAMSIIDVQGDSKFNNHVYPSDRIVPQIDLFKIYHFDNKAKTTSLKSLEFNMRSDNIKDLPFPVGSVLVDPQIDVLRQYNQHDVEQTKRFYHQSEKMVLFREELTKKYSGKDWLNFNDTKIGKEYFVMELEKAFVPCYEFGPHGRKPLQTVRPVVHLRDCILPWIDFKRPEFSRILHWLKQQSITETKGVFKNLTATVNGFEFVFGLGGIHGSVDSEIVESDDEYAIIDLDVTSYYPNLAIVNGFYPEHLGKQFCLIYKHLFEQRKQYPKKSAENAMLKLALNGVYGDSNNQFSVFYDPQFTMSITLNGQLLLCKLAEMLLEIEGIRIIQINTDGLTVQVKRSDTGRIEQIKTLWQQQTGLSLEQAIYKTMFVRDVNNYIGLFEDGGTKRKGAYEWNAEWHQNAGGLVIPKVAEKVLVESAPIRETVENWPDKMDFMLRTKVPRNSYLQWGEGQVQNTTRYYVAKGGHPLVKWMPPLKGKTEWRKIGVESGWNVQVCNDIADATLPVDYDYYVERIEKLCLGLA
jgi:hypothetical protein